MGDSSVLLMGLAQGDGLSLNTTTLGIVITMVVSLVGAIVFLFKMVTSSQARQIDKLTEERDRALTQLMDVLRTADRSADAAEEATRLLDARRPRKR